MDIDVNLKIYEDEIIAGGSRVASGYVTVGRVLKFPVTVRRYKDKESGKEKQFVSYPQHKNGDGYAYTVYPTDPDLKKEIDGRVLQEVRDKMLDGRLLGDDEVRVKVALLEPDPNAAVKTLAVCSAEIVGVTVNRILVREGRYGRFVEMPQHLSGGKYQDTAYATNHYTQTSIQQEILDAYVRQEAKVQKVREMLKETDRSGLNVPKLEDVLREDDRQLAAAMKRAAAEGAYGLRYRDIRGREVCFDGEARGTERVYYRKTIPDYGESYPIYRAEFVPPPEWGWPKPEPAAEPEVETPPAPEPNQPENPPEPAADQPENPPEPETTEARFLAAYGRGDTGGMLAALYEADESEFTITETVYTDDGKVILANAAFGTDTRIDIAFANDYEPGKPMRRGVRQEIMAFVPAKDGSTDICSLMDRVSENEKDGELGYRETERCWIAIVGKQGISAKAPENAVEERTPARPIHFAQPRR